MTDALLRAITNADPARQWYRISNADPARPRRAKVLLYDVIGSFWGITARDFVRELTALDVDEIELHIHSPGGAVYDAIAIRNALVQHPARVTSIVDGLAASAASFIALAGDEVIMAPNSELMIHDPSGLCWGTAEDMSKMRDDLERIAANIASMYADRAGGDAAEWRARMLAETWYSADEAVAAGLADRVDGSTASTDDVENRWDLSVFNFAGRSKAPAPFPAHAATYSHTASAVWANPPAGEPSGDTTQEGELMFTDSQLTTLRQTVGVADDADADTILAALDEALAERADAAPTPDGTVVVDAAALDELRANAAAGRAARDQQEQQHRECLVTAALKDGRIPAASRDRWLNLLKADPNAEQALANLAPGLIPVDEIGSDSAASAAAADDVYAAIYGRD